MKIKDQFSLSLSNASWRQQLSVALALMTVIPILTFGYFLIVYIMPSRATPESLTLVISLNLVLAFTGVALLTHTFKSLLQLRRYLDSVAQGYLTQALTIHDGPEVNNIVKSVNAIVGKLLTDNQKLQLASQELEERVRKRTEDIRKTCLELEEREQQLRTNEARLKDVTFSIADWMWEVDKNCVYTYSSSKGFDLFGDVIGKTPFDFMPPDEGRKVAAKFSEIAKNKAPIKDVENWNIRKNGERICLLTNGVPIIDEAGNLTGYRGVDKDITEHMRAKESLMASEARFKELFENMSSGVAVYEPQDNGNDFVFKNLNSAGERIEGQKKEDLLGRSVLKVRPDIKRFGLFDVLQRVYRTGVPERFSGFYKDDRASGWYDNFIYRIPSGEIVAIFDNVTESKRMEEEIRFKNTLLLTQQDAAIDGILVVDEKGKILSSNKRFVDIWDIPSDIMESNSDERALQSVLDKLTNPEEFIRKVKYLYRARNETSRDEIVLKDGRTFDRYSAPMLGAAGKYYGRVWYFRDITERRQAEEKVVRDYQMQTAINTLLGFSMDNMSVTEYMENVLDLILSLKWLTFESKGCIFLADEKRQILHLQAHRGLPDSLLAMCGTVPFGRCVCGKAAVERTIQFVDRVGDAHEVRYEGIMPHGHYSVPILFGDHVLGVINLYSGEGYIRDPREEVFLKAVANTLGGAIERKRAKDDLKEANVQLQKSLGDLKLAQQTLIQQERLSALGQMVSGIAHDFNNVLMPILGFSELLLSNSSMLDNRKESRHMIEIILSAAKDAKHIVRRMRTIYKSDDGVEYELLDAANVVESAISLTMSKWKEEMRAKGVAIDIVTDFRPVPGINVNKSELREALTNLILNAVDAMPKGGAITFRVYLKNGISVVLEVKDTGHGMDEKTLLRCGEPFFTTKGTQGSGLGLAMVHGIVERHGGTVSIESKPGAGTMVRMLFPVSRETNNTNGDLEQAAKSLSPLRILVIDDEKRSLNLIEKLLKSDSHRFEMVDNGGEGLDMLRKNKYDLIITDRAMPSMSGDEVARGAQNIQPGIPVIMLTGFGDIMKESGECPPGVSRIMSKPVTGEELRRVMASVMKKARGS